MSRKGFNLSSASSIFSPLTDVRTVTSPWPWVDFTFGVLRSDHDDAVAWQTAHQGDMEMAGRLYKAQMKAQILSNFEGRGMRQQARRSRRNVSGQGDPGLSPQALAQAERLLDKELGTLDLREARSRVDSDFNRQRVYAALILLRWWRDITQDNEEMPCTLENRLKFLAWEGTLVWVPVGTAGIPEASRRERELAGDVNLSPVFLDKEEVAALEPTGALARFIRDNPAAVTIFDGHQYRLEDGQPLAIQPSDDPARPHPYENELVGDALTMLILDESEAAGKERGEVVASAEANLGNGPDGRAATGMP